MDIGIEQESPGDGPAIRGVVLAAFAHHPQVADMVEAIRASPQYEPELSLLARVEGGIAGFVMVSHAAVVDGEREHDVLTLSPLAVAPDRQRRGIGSALVRAALAAADRTGAPLVTLEGSPSYYRRLGFRSATESGITIELPEWAPPEAAQVFPLSGYRAEVRGRLVYPPAFDVAR